MPEIIVKGTAEALLPPTRAVLSVTVIRRAPVQSTAVQECADLCAQVDQVLDDVRGSLIRQARTTSVRTQAEWDYTNKSGRRLTGYMASRSTEVDAEPDGPGLTSLVSALAGLKGVQLGGPRWDISPGAPGWEDVRANAAQDCHSRAAAYARGLGATVGNVRWVAEPGLRETVSGGGPMAGATFAATRSAVPAAGGSPEEEPRMVTIVPEPITVHVAVEAAFDLA